MSVRDVALEALLSVEAGESFGREALERRRPEAASPRDRALLTELVYGTLRRRGTLDALLATASRTSLARLDPVVAAALRMGLYQVVFLDRVPAHAAVDHAVEATRTRKGARLAGFVNAVLRNLVRAIEGPARGDEDPRRDVPREGGVALRLRHPTFPDPASDLAGNLSARTAHPRFLVERWLARFGEAATRDALAAGSSRPPIVLRARPGGREALLAELAAGGVAARAGPTPDAVVVLGDDEAGLEPVKAGRADVQDATAQRVAPLLDVRAGDSVLDLCAAPGGKSLHVLDLLGGRGELVACDVAAEKVEALARLLEARAPTGVRARAVRVEEGGPLPFAPESFHGVLVDAPCSNTGVLRRRPEVRTRLRPGDPASLSALQRSLVLRAMPLVAPRGRLVYSTCSVEPEENEEVVRAALATAPGWRLEPGFSALPSLDADGGFASVLLRE
jgi:16S rRNA (cytosine967-C5)-methyltransferase